MATRKRISAAETYVLDDETLEELGDASLTGVMRDVTDTIRRMEIDQQQSDRESGESYEDDDEFNLGFLIPDD